MDSVKLNGHLYLCHPHGEMWNAEVRVRNAELTEKDDVRFIFHPSAFRIPPSLIIPIFQFCAKRTEQPSSIKRGVLMRLIKINYHVMPDL